MERSQGKDLGLLVPGLIDYSSSLYTLIPVCKMEEEVCVWVGWVIKVLVIAAC